MNHIERRADPSCYLREELFREISEIDSAKVRSIARAMENAENSTAFDADSRASHFSISRFSIFVAVPYIIPF